MSKPNLTRHEVAKHNRLNDIWLIIDNKVWDFTDFIREHPGGMAVIGQNAGKDATVTYSEVHSPGLVQAVLTSSKLMGEVPPLQEDQSNPKRPRKTRPVTIPRSLVQQPSRREQPGKPSIGRFTRRSRL